MASTIASPVPLRFNQSQRTTNELKAADAGRDTPLPQYEQTQSVPFTLKLQEDARNPGQFQLVLNVGSNLQTPDGIRLNAPLEPQRQATGASTGDAIFKPESVSPPMTPLADKQGWADLDHVPPEFLQKVVPDWSVSFSRSDSTVSTQSKRLSDIKARIKKKGKGYVVRLLKGSATDLDEIAEVDLGSQTTRTQANDVHELDSAPRPAELYSSIQPAPSNHVILADRPDVFEIGTSNEDGVTVLQNTIPPVSDSTYPTHSGVLLANSLARNSAAEDGMSDAETLIPDIRSKDGRVDGDQTDSEPFSQIRPFPPERSGSVSSIVRTPTRGLSLIGPVRKRVEKRTRPRMSCRTTQLELKRSDAQKSVKRRFTSTATGTESSLAEFYPKSTNLRQRVRPTFRKSNDYDQTSDEYGTWQHPIRNMSGMKSRHLRQLSADDLQLRAKSRNGLRLETNLPKTKSAHSSPVTQRRISPRTRRLKSSPPSPIETGDTDTPSSPEWQEERGSHELKEALDKAFSNIAPGLDKDDQGTDTRDIPIPQIVEPTEEVHVGEIPLPWEIEIRSAPTGTRHPTLMYWGLALSALSDKVYEGFRLLQDAVGPERPVPKGHVRVRWTCSCGESLYDDFIEQRPNAARLLEAYLNRPRARTPRSPTSQSSTASSMASIFDSSSRASTLATPSSTYSGPASWTRGSDSSNYSPSRVQNANSFSVRMPNFAQESWLLTCANEGRLTPKIVHLDVNEGRIRSDKDLALSLREHYDQLHRGFLNWTRLRGLTTIEFVQFEVHRNRFADIRATPSMPPKSAISSASTNSESEKSQAPSQHPYTFEPNDLLPPVGSTYLLHLFQHPNDYDGELITYLRSPKRRQRLEFGMGWGVHLVEGFLARRVWAVTMCILGLGSAAFAILWTVKKGDVQGAFGVAQWVLGIAALLVGGVQAWLE